MWFLLYFLVGRYLLFNSVKLNTGNDERPLLKNCSSVDITVIKEYHRKIKLLHYLQNSRVSEEDKINTINTLQMFDNLNPNCIKPANITIGLNSDF